LTQTTTVFEPQTAPLADAAGRRRGLFFLTMAVACVGFTLSLQTGLNANFVAQTMLLRPEQQGLLEAARESCGILSIVALALLAGISEPRIGALVLVILAVGLSAYAVVPSFHWLIVASIVWSQGFHVWQPLPNSMAVALAEKDHEGRALGRLGAAGAIGSTIALVLALLLNKAGIAIRPMWYIAGAASLLGALACMFIPRNIKAPGQSFIIRRRYGLFYLLQFLEGWRKQIFIAFAGYMLVKRYNVPIPTMLILFLASNIVGWFSAPIVGRLIDCFGERRILLFYYSTMAVVFVCYALVNSVYPLYVLFVADSILFVCTMALTTYVTRLAPPEEHTATLSAGVAANHVASVMMPLVGGLLWDKLGYQWAFLAGSAMAILTLFVVRRIPRREPSPG
jgi:predicted MFS family arabinose efflux permease